MAAIVSFSGAIEEGDALFPESRARPPVLMIQGDGGGVASFAAMSATKERLKAQGVPVRNMRRPGFGIDGR